MCGCDIFTLNTSFTARVLFLIPANRGVIQAKIRPTTIRVLFLIPTTCWDVERGERTFCTTAPTAAWVLFLIPEL